MFLKFKYFMICENAKFMCAIEQISGEIYWENGRT